jgi:hypothetical protein
MNCFIWSRTPDARRAKSRSALNGAPRQWTSKPSGDARFIPVKTSKRATSTDRLHIFTPASTGRTPKKNPTVDERRFPDRFQRSRCALEMESLRGLENRNPSLPLESAEISAICGHSSELSLVQEPCRTPLISGFDKTPPIDNLRP